MIHLEMHGIQLMEERKVSNFDIPCENCVCLAICKQKQAHPMFRQCDLIMTFCRDFIDESSNRAVAADMLDLGNMINEILGRHFMPYLTSQDKDRHTMGFIDIHPNYYDDTYLDLIHITYTHFRDVLNINLLEVERLKPFLYPLVYTLEKDR